MMSINTPDTVTYDFAERLYFSALYLRDFIAMQPANNPLRWIGDGKSRVVDMPHFKSACEVITEFETNYFTAKQS